MGRYDSVVKAVRIPNEVYGEIEERLGGKAVNKWLNELIEKELTGGRASNETSSVEDFDFRDKPEFCDDNARDNSEAGLPESLRKFVQNAQKTDKDFFNGLEGLIRDKKLVFYGGILTVSAGESYREFELLCTEHGYNPANIMKNFVREIRAEKGW